MPDSKLNAEVLQECHPSCDKTYYGCINNGTQTGGCYFIYRDCVDKCARPEPDDPGAT